MKLIACPHCGDTYPDFDVAHMCSRGPYAPQLKPRMNERIRQLAEQARDFYLLQEDLDCSTKELHKLVDTKFAELIVRECISNVEVWEKDSRNHISYMLKQHFGVGSA